MLAVQLIVALLLAAAHAAVDQVGDCAVLGIHTTTDDFAILLLDSMASGGPARALTFQ